MRENESDEWRKLLAIFFLKKIVFQKKKIIKY